VRINEQFNRFNRQIGMIIAFIGQNLQRWERRKLEEVLECYLTCFSVAMKRVIYSTVTGSSTVSLWLWHSTRALFITTRASAVSPIDTVKTLQECISYNTVFLVKGFQPPPLFLNNAP
jgi:hypothetical protein